MWFLKFQMGDMANTLFFIANAFWFESGSQCFRGKIFILEIIFWNCLNVGTISKPRLCGVKDFRGTWCYICVWYVYKCYKMVENPGSVRTGCSNEYVCFVAYNGVYFFRVSTGLSVATGDTALLARGGATFIRWWMGNPPGTYPAKSNPSWIAKFISSSN